MTQQVSVGLTDPLERGACPPRSAAAVWADDDADQSHFIRSFRQFTGTTPTRFLTDPDLFVGEVLRARVRIASTHPLGLFVR